MKSSEILFVGLPPAALAVARQAVHQAFPNRGIVTMTDLPTALLSPAASGPQLLVMADSAASVVIEATQAVEKNGLPRWAVVLLGPGESDLAETVAVHDWNP